MYRMWNPDYKLKATSYRKLSITITFVFWKQTTVSRYLSEKTTKEETSKRLITTTQRLLFKLYKKKRFTKSSFWMDVQVIIIHCFIPEGRFSKQQNYYHTLSTSLYLLPVRSPDTLLRNKIKNRKYNFMKYLHSKGPSALSPISLSKRLI